MHPDHLSSPSSLLRQQFAHRHDVDPAVCARVQAWCSSSSSSSSSSSNNNNNNNKSSSSSSNAASPQTLLSYALFKLVVSAACSADAAAVRHTSHVTRHTSHVTRHTSHVTRHTHVSSPLHQGSPPSFSLWTSLRHSRLWLTPPSVSKPPPVLVERRRLGVLRQNLQVIVIVLVFLEKLLSPVHYFLQLNAKFCYIQLHIHTCIHVILFSSMKFLVLSKILLHLKQE
jgi:hypothetical protein